MCNLIINAPYRQSLRREYIKHKNAEVARQRANGVIGKIRVKTSREKLIVWTEKYMSEFNEKECANQSFW